MRARHILLVTLTLATASGAAAQPAKRVLQCTPVGGTVMTNFISDTRTLGTATGDLAGAVSADLLNPPAPGADGTIVFTVQHHWVTATGDTVNTSVAQAITQETAPGLFSVLSYPLTIQGGTGRFEDAVGIVRSIGVVDARTQHTVFRYSGEVCYRIRLK